MSDFFGTPVIAIGDYFITRHPRGGFWIAHKDGEGMQVSEEKLVKMLTDFWNKEF